MKNEKKKIDAGIVFGLLPKQYCEFFFFLYCKVPIVLQLEGLEGIEIVLQYTKCIVGEEVG